MSATLEEYRECQRCGMPSIEADPVFYYSPHEDIPLMQFHKLCYLAELQSAFEKFYGRYER